MTLRPRPASACPACSFALVSFILAVGIPVAGAAQDLTPTESRVADWVDAHTGEAVDLLQRLVDINSGTMNHAGVRRVGDVLAAELDALGFETEWIDMGEADRAGHLFARRDGGDGKRILLIGHLDTVFEEDDPFQTFQREGSEAAGPGVSDMKGGDVVIIQALKALEAAGALEGTNIVVAFTGDEESPEEPLELARRDLEEAGRRADVALGFESGVRDEEGEYATVARRSSSEWLLEVTGRQAHSSGIFGDDVGAGAIFEAARILEGFYDEVRGEEYLTFNAGTILGGTDVEYDRELTRGSAFGKTNVVPRRVVVHGGIRTISTEQLETARSAMRAVAARHLPRTDATVTFTDGYPPMAPTEGNTALYHMLNGVSADLGLDSLLVLDPGRRGAADISFVAPYTDGLAGLGVYGSGSHTPEERIDLDSLVPATKRAALLILRLSRMPAGPMVDGRG
ncbi:MAG TPA: M20/M25/M40 family metallo-hydrolase [Longimicrobiales bacterium]|nr:M20/M25/M40 family metallo-hydrolase [Longimicrobiales bacterium]